VPGENGPFGPITGRHWSRHGGQPSRTALSI
jgi:hypothetical protein